MCSSYTSGLCGVQEPTHDMGEMPSARLTPPDIQQVLLRYGGTAGEDPGPEEKSDTPVHFGLADRAFLAPLCGEAVGFCTDRVGEVSCQPCLETYAKTLSSTPDADLNDRDPEPSA